MMHQQTFLTTLLNSSMSKHLSSHCRIGTYRSCSQVFKGGLYEIDEDDDEFITVSSLVAQMWCRWPKIMRGRPASRLFGTTYPAQGTTVFRWPGLLLNLPASELQFSCMYIPIELAATVYLHSNLLVIGLQPDNIYIVLIHIGNSYNYCVRLQCCYCTMIRYLVRYLSVM